MVGCGRISGVDYFLCQFSRYLRVIEAGVRDEFRQSAFKGTNISRNMHCQIFADIVGQRHAFGFRLGFRDCGARFRIGRHDIGDEAAFET